MHAYQLLSTLKGYAMLSAFFLKKVKLVFASHELASKNNRPVPGCPVLLFNSTDAGCSLENLRSVF